MSTTSSELCKNRPWNICMDPSYAHG